VTDYRNLSAAVLEPAPQLTVLCGANGQGKTNLLEAVWLLTGGKSFRGAKDAELIRRGADFAVLEAAFEAGDRPQEIRLTVGAKGTQRPGRTVRLNGADRGRAASIAGTFTAGRKGGGISWMPRSASCTPATWRRNGGIYAW